MLRVLGLAEFSFFDDTVTINSRTGVKSVEVVYPG
jgi:hypothetical protein